MFNFVKIFSYITTKEKDLKNSAVGAQMLNSCVSSSGGRDDDTQSMPDVRSRESETLLHQRINSLIQAAHRNIKLTIMWEEMKS